MNIVAIIPARFASTRFPGKPLVDIGGTSMIQRVYQQVALAKKIHEIVVATDDQRIIQHVQAFGGRVVMTSNQHQSGTDRCYEAMCLQKNKFDYVLNIQGDEPFIDPMQIDRIADHLNGQQQLVTLIKKIELDSQFQSPNVVKVVFNKQSEALYFSRAPIPHVRDATNKNRIQFKHIGMYAYRADVLAAIAKLPMSNLEQMEGLEQLRWLENGFKIQVVETNQDTISIDTPEDVVQAMACCKNKN